MHAGTEVDDGALHTALLALERVGAFTRIGYGPDALYAVKPPLPLPAAMQASPQGELQHPFVYNITLAGTSLHCIRLRCPVCSQANLHVPEAMLASPQGELLARSVLSVRARSLGVMLVHRHLMQLQCPFPGMDLLCRNSYRRR